MAHKTTSGSFDSRTGEYPLFYTQQLCHITQSTVQLRHKTSPPHAHSSPSYCRPRSSVASPSPSTAPPAEPLFLAKEVAEILEIQSSRQMVQMVDEEEKLMYTIHTSGQARDTWMLTEQGLYEVLMQSRKPVARQFKAGVKALLKALRTGEQPATPAPSGTYLRRTARLMQSVSNQMHELRRRFAELDEASQMLATTRQEPTPIAGLDPIIMRGRVWYPLRGLLKSVTGSKDPKIEHYTERYPDRTMVYYQMSYCDEPLARYIVARTELRQRQEALTAPLFDNL